MHPIHDSLPELDESVECDPVIDCNLDAVPIRVAIVGNAYHEETFSGVAAYARKVGWDLDATFFHNPGCLPKQEDWSGVLATPILSDVAAWVRELRCPVVELLTTTHADPSRPKVVPDTQAIGRCGAGHLMDLGNVRFGLYRVLATQSECGKGFVEEIEARGYSVALFDLDLRAKRGERTRTTRSERVAWLCERIGELVPPMAIMAEDDRFAVDLWFAARTLGLRVPDDVAILGVENQKLVLDSAPIEISSVDANFFELGWRGAEVLNQLINGATVGSEEAPLLTQVAPKGVVVRNSTSTFVCDDPGVAAAAMFVRRRFREPITVANVAAEARMSVRSLQTKYPAYIGRGVKEDILWHRVMEAKSLIERTDLKIAAVAAESGLGTAAHLYRVFHQLLETTPHAWRLRHGIRRVS